MRGRLHVHTYVVLFGDELVKGRESAQAHLRIHAQRLRMHVPVGMRVQVV